jgi:NADPH:quinone reductase-like Zn-dependent oxidoreductase
MKALTFNPRQDLFRIADIPMPKPGDFDVLVKVEACGLNPVDAKIGLWKSMVPDMNEFWVPGLDVAGQIVEMGKDVRGWSVGDRVLYHGNMFRAHGGFAEYAIQDSQTLIPHPALSPTIAAATPCAGWTAWRALHDKLRAYDHDSILIAGGSGGVGGFAIQVAKYLGLVQIMVTCSARNQSYVKELGATHVIDYRTEEVVGRVLEITDQRGVTLGLDTVGFDTDILVANSLAYEGHMVELVDTLRPANYNDAFMKGLSFHQLSLGSGHRYGKVAKDKLVSAGKSFSKLVEQGHVKVPVLKIITLDEVASALKEMLRRRTVGKVVMAI